MGQNGGARPGAGRKAKAEKFKQPIARAEKRIADGLPQLIDNMLMLANGGYERVEEEWQPAGLIYIGSGEFARRAFPELEPDKLVLVKRKRSVADRDRAANEYLINRILGKPTERQEVSGPNSGPIPVQAFDYAAAIAPIADGSGEDSDPSSTDEGAGDGEALG